jgi:hypothetical protein
MKKMVLILAALCLFAPVFAQELPEYHAASGQWVVEDGRLYQNDAASRLAKLNIANEQQGSMIYEFSVKYEGGGEDGQGGFGIHVFVPDSGIYHRASWGSGDSYLLWLNYDEDPSDPAIPAGLSAQVYHSLNSWDMELEETIDLNGLIPALPDDVLETAVSFVIRMNGDSGEIRIYDPTDETGESYLYYYIDETKLPQKGEWVSLRTNGVKLSFGQ